MADDVAQGFGLAPLGTHHETAQQRTNGADRGAPFPPAAGPTVLDPGRGLDWHARAACRPELRPPDLTLAEWVDVFFPNRGDSVTAARRVCLECPVRDACLDHALATGEKHGIWGGASERARRRMRRNRRAA